MRRWLSLWLCLWPFFLVIGAPSIQYEEAPSVATTEGVPSNLVNQSVCVISGEYTDSVLDVVLPGPESLVIQRHYSSKSPGSFGHSWSFNHRENLIFGEAIYDKDEPIPVWLICLRQPSGAQLDYIYPKSKDISKKKHLSFQLLVPKGMTNGANHLSGQTNLKNQAVHFYPENQKIVSISGSGSRSTFVPIDYDEEDGLVMWRQETEEKANGSLYTYECKPKDLTKLSRIICQSKKMGTRYSYVKFEQVDASEEHPIVAIKTSDGRHLKYHFKRHRYKRTEKTRTTKDTYHITNYYLSKVDHPYAPHEHYEYEEKELSKDLQLVCKKRPGGRFVAIDYYHRGINRVGGLVGCITIDDDDDYRLDRVKKLQAPVGTDQTPITTHRFVYHCKLKKHKKDGRKELQEGTTDVYDAYDHLTRYAYDDSHRLSSITRYQGGSDEAPYTKESFLWGKNDSPQEGNLLGKIFKDGQGHVHHARYFTYDAYGNVLTSSLCGRLTGLSAPDIVLDASKHPISNGYECESKSYTYSEDGLNLVLSETDSNGKTIFYDYINGTDHLRAKYVAYEGQIQLREFYFYDDHFVLIRKITDDGKSPAVDDLTGVTERHLTDIQPRKSTPFGLPENMQESCLDLTTGQQKLIRGTHFDYSPQGRLLKQDIFDANGQLAYTLTWEYDDHGNVISETNALGQTTIKKYDANDNLIFEQGPSADFYIQNSYDFANRLIRQEEIHADGKHFVTTHRYDYLGQCIATINPYSHETRQDFDDFGRVVAIHYPAVLNEEGQWVYPTVSKIYDIAGYPICVTDAKGRQTKIEYNIRGQLIQIIHPDHTTEQLIYRLDGQLVEKREKNGLRIVYLRDPLGRITEESCYAPDGQLLKKTQHVYNALHLLQSIDSEGGITEYSYDAAGRLEWTRQGEQVKQNIYDSLGRLAEIREWFGDGPDEYRSTIKGYDLLDRMLEERLQSSDGTVLHLARYAYNANGDCTLVQSGDQKTWTEYDHHHNPVKITNAAGHVTHTIYNTDFINAYGQRVLQAITTDSLGYQTIHTYDAANRLVEIGRKNPFGVQVARQLIFYDLCGNRCRVCDEVIQEGTVSRTIETLYVYSDGNQVTALIEALGTPEQKVTRTEYNPFGQKATWIKPDGKSVFYTYDALGRLKTLSSSDGSISYRYDYNTRDQVTRVKDLRLKLVTERLYDKSGQLTKEKLGNGLSLSYFYDKMGRVNKVILPDETGIEYIYDAADLKEVHRLVGGKRVYTHFNQSHTLSGQVTKAKLPGKGGRVSYSYNALGRCMKIHSPQFQQSVPVDGFDAAGNLLCFYLQDVPYTFSYDDYYQVKSEKGHVEHSYAFDSLANRLIKDGEVHSHNALNQVLKKGKEKFVYDANGNLIQRIKGKWVICYTYDALDRLVTIDQEGKETTYVYDAFNRRLSKQQPGQKKQFFVYQSQEEVGMWSQGAFQELRLLGKNPRNPMVALELKGTPYVPLHDLSGNVACLLNHQGGVVERYRYTAFGETEILSPTGEVLVESAVGNPWQYASKRLDQESDLVAFGLRYYEPELGRWITPDPAGYADGSNLYAYVHNSPLLYYDQFGLYTNTGLFGAFGSHIFNFAYDNLSTFYCGCQELNQCIFGKPEPVVKHVEIENDLEAKYNFRAGQNPDKACKPFERTAAYSLNDDGFINPDTGKPFQLKTSKDKCTVFACGILNDRACFNDSMIHLGRLSEFNVKGVHNATFGIVRDVLCYFDSLFNYAAYEGVRELHKIWYDFFSHCSNHATLLMICHSRGALYVKNALLSFPEDLRKRIEVIAIAPGAYIDPYLCKSIKHYESTGDLVPCADMEGRRRCRDTIIRLNPQPGSFAWFDHSFTSPTYTAYIRRAIEKYNAR
jgi:RHS repeat-associated protein